MRNVVIIDAIRTPMGRSKKGAFRHIRAEALSAHLLTALLQRNPTIDPLEIEDIYWGSVQQTLEQGFNIARNAALLAELPHSIAAVTVNRLCGSSMQALHDGARAILCKDAEIVIAGGVEHMGHIPMNYGIDFHPSLGLSVSKNAANMGLTAELLGKKYQISRHEMDQFAARSHRHAHLATIEGLFSKEIIPTLGHSKSGALARFDFDEVIRPDTTKNKLATLPPVFIPDSGTITAGNASAVADGASALLLMSDSKAKELNLQPMAKIRAMAVTGCEPALMGIGPLPATQKLLHRAKLTLDEVELIEINEAFAAQTLACIKAMKLEEQIDEKLNLNGGAIALGHPLGCSGARICATLLHQMIHRQKSLGLATMCIGMGQGIATLFERI